MTCVRTTHPVAEDTETETATRTLPREADEENETENETGKNVRGKSASLGTGSRVCFLLSVTICYICSMREG